MRREFIVFQLRENISHNQIITKDFFFKNSRQILPSQGKIFDKTNNENCQKRRIFVAQVKKKNLFYICRYNTYMFHVHDILQF